MLGVTAQPCAYEGSCPGRRGLCLTFASKDTAWVWNDHALHRAVCLVLGTELCSPKIRMLAS